MAKPEDGHESLTAIPKAGEVRSILCVYCRYDVDDIIEQKPSADLLDVARVLCDVCMHRVNRWLAPNEVRIGSMGKP